jgi:hypothetical protein
MTLEKYFVVKVRRKVVVVDYHYLNCIGVCNQKTLRSIPLVRFKQYSDGLCIKDEDWIIHQKWEKSYISSYSSTYKNIAELLHIKNKNLLCYSEYIFLFNLAMHNSFMSSLLEFFHEFLYLSKKQYTIFLMEMKFEEYSYENSMLLFRFWGNNDFDYKFREQLPFCDNKIVPVIPFNLLTKNERFFECQDGFHFVGGCVEDYNFFLIYLPHYGKFLWVKHSQIRSLFSTYTGDSTFVLSGKVELTDSRYLMCKDINIELVDLKEKNSVLYPGITNKIEIDSKDKFIDMTHNIAFHNDWICPSCKIKVKKKDDRMRIHQGKNYSHFHMECFISLKEIQKFGLMK